MFFASLHAMDSMEKKTAAELEKALEEIQRLRRENAQLRKKLGIDISEAKADYTREPSSVAVDTGVEKTQAARVCEEHTPQNSSRTADVDSNFSSREKIRRFRSLFRGREDVYALLWVNDRTGKKGYSPACEDPWSSRIGNPKKYLPLTDEVMLRHLTEKKPSVSIPCLRMTHAGS
jgi:TOTE conflict system, Archaeo-Eukaryotic Primase domain